MNNRQLAQVGIGFIGVSSLVTAVDLFARITMAQGGWVEPAAIVPVVLPLLIYVGLSYWLVFHNSSIATAITREVSAESVPASADLALVLLPVVGVLLLGQAIPSFANTVVNLVLSGRFGVESSTVPLLVRLLATGIQVAFAIYVIARPERLLAFLQKRTAAQTA